MNNISYERISLLVESYIEEGSNGELLSIGYIERCFYIYSGADDVY